MADADLPPDADDNPGATAKFDLETLRRAMRAEPQLQPTLSITTGAQSGRVVPLTQDSVVLGRGSDADITLIGRGISRKHARVERVDDTNAGEGSYRLRDLGSTNGTLVGGNPITACALADGDLFLLGPDTSIKFSYEDSTEVDARARRYEESIHDDLTGIYNRRYFLMALEHELAYSARHNEPTSVAILDVDRFKQLNDRFGHPAGDVVLKRIASGIEAKLRREDIVARYGGEEFAMCLRGLGRDRAFEAMERVRELIASLTHEIQGCEIRITASIGLGCVAGLSEVTASTVLETADRNLYAAKHQGRNRTCLDPEHPSRHADYASPNSDFPSP